MTKNKKNQGLDALHIEQDFMKRDVSGGLYEPRYEHDSCGLGFIANIDGIKSHKIIRDGIRILENLEHRGATGADPLMGDGAGMLVQIPHEFFFEECNKLGFTIPKKDKYAVGFFFMPQDKNSQRRIKSLIENVSTTSGCSITTSGTKAPAERYPLLSIANK